MDAVERFDLVVIGSGPAGEKGAAQASYFGKRVALVEKAPAVGGACVHTGTLPSKTLREAALYLTGFQKRELYGMTLDLDRQASVRRLMGRLRAVTDEQVAQISRNLDRHQVTLVRGAAEFASTHEVIVRDTADSQRPARRLRADVFLIATGSSPLRPAGIPFHDPDVEDSDSILNLDRIPDSLAVVGGGVVGCEYACIFAALGTRITIVEGRPVLMQFLDQEISKSLQQSLEREGHRVRLGDAVHAIERIPGGSLRLSLQSREELLVDKVLYSAGRAGNTAGLGLARAGVVTDRKGRLLVNGHFQTSTPHIYAAGDVVGSPALASISMEQGRVAMCHAFNLDYKTRVAPLTPFGVYTIPEISMIGATEDELRRTNVDYEVGRTRYEHNVRGQITGEKHGLLKLLFEVPSKKLLGVHMIGDNATELIHIGQMAMTFDGTIDVFIDSVFNFPTLSEAYKYAAYDGLGRLARRDSGRCTPMSELNKRIVQDFYELAFNQRQPEAAVAKYVGSRYRQHNPMAGDGTAPFISFVKWLAGANPEFRFDFKRFIAEGDFVVVHSHLVPSKGARGTAVMDIFRLEDGKIVEHWDVLQDVPEKAENQNTMF